MRTRPDLHDSRPHQNVSGRSGGHPSLVGWDGRAAIRRAEQVLASNCFTRPRSPHEKQNAHCRPVCICQKFCREAGAVLKAQFSQSDASSPKSFLDILSSILLFWALKWCFDSLGPLKSLIWKRNGLGKSLEKLQKSDFDGCNPAIKPLT